MISTASGMIATMRTQGTLVSMTVVSVVITHYLKDQSVDANNVGQFIESMQMSLTLFGILGISGIVCSMVIKDNAQDCG